MSGGRRRSILAAAGYYMGTKAIPPVSSHDITKLLDQYRCGPIQFTGTGSALYERHLFFVNVVDLAAATARDRFEALARSVRDVLSRRRVLTEKTYEVGL